ncbi:RnfABCDGE type electron transport complex subunit B [Sporanaerobacter acetigenes]|uniref:Ion-translocating oxidoreductase complex subunit B n=1 Tax=Sporanaerobacter acetigenes DSM 13106 TaxID=1123281 RepID=A0A1M5UXZ2_9FIRM|nr:RnfABCDGE type electron transport complex subunit B [Sporanaerobacter acetigenes]SHH67754.1 electron transport complex, RnfABCDGE type, B subunit [Sporanaerobacter acetigenes DSM 13106]
MSTILYPLLVLGGLGLLFGVILSLASKAFAVETDPKVEEIRSVLPGANCGACGFPGCDGLANAIAEGKAPVNGCAVGGKAVADKVAEIMGVSGQDAEKMVAKVLCQGTDCKAIKKYEYTGLQDCKAANIVAGGNKGCQYGCLGFGTCKDVCQFEAIEIIDGIANIDPEKCTSCGQCIKACPKGIIELVPYKQKVIVKCKSSEFGKSVKEKCTIGCIGCQMCVKACPTDPKAMQFENNLAHIDYEKCINCGLCAQKCPTGAIWSMLKKREEVKEA